MISPKYFDQFWRNFAQWCILALQNLPVVQKSNFKNPRWRMDAILKIVKLVIFATVWPIFMKFCMVGILALPTWLAIKKVRNFENPRRWMAANLKIKKLQYLCNCLADLDKFLHSDTHISPPANVCLKYLEQSCFWKLLPVNSNTVVNQYLVY